MTRDAGMIALIDHNFTSDVWLTSEGKADKPQQITSAETAVSVSWLRDDNIIIQNAKGDLVRFDRNGATAYC